jgi:type III secretion protein J
VLKTLVVVFCALLMHGCSVNVSSDLTERESTEMVVALSAYGIGASKSSSDGKKWAVSVARHDLTPASQALVSSGLPRQDMAGVADLMKKESLVSSPALERTKMHYVLGNELARSLLEIDGVVSARVHVVVPERDPFRDKPKVSSASVLIKHAPNLKAADLDMAVKSFVSRGIEGLLPENVSVTFIAARAPWGNVGKQSVDYLMYLPLLLIPLGGAVLFFVWNRFMPGRIQENPVSNKENMRRSP